jgi:predicted Zn-dependent peptidase
LKKLFDIDRLPNNLRIISSFMPGMMSVTINLMVKVGSRYESANENGICHFLEHMAFKGTKTRTYKQIAEEFDRIGGQFNAYTSRECTVYYAKVLTQHMGIALSIFSDILQNSTFEKSEIEKERNVILQEIAQVQDSPDDLVYDNLMEEAFADQPLGKSILGTEDILSTFDTEALSNYVKKYYNGDNMVLSVAGNINHPDLMRLASELFGSIPKGESSRHSSALYTPGGKFINKDLEQVNIVLGFQGISYFAKKEYYKAQVLSLILGGGTSSRLFQNIREKHGLVYSVGSFNSSYSDVGLFCVYGSTTQENVNNLIDQTNLEMKKICQQVSDEELIRAKEQIRASMLMAEEKASYRCEDLAKSFAMFDEYIHLDEILQEIEALSISEIVDIACKIFSSAPVISVVGPEIKMSYEEIAEKLRIT